jgi:hypothetical protein
VPTTTYSPGGGGTTVHSVLTQQRIPQVRSHPFFAGIDWDALEKRQLEAPYLPPISSLNDMTNFDQYHDQAIPVSQYDDTNDTVWRGWGHCNPDQKPK